MSEPEKSLLERSPFDWIGPIDRVTGLITGLVAATTVLSVPANWITIVLGIAVGIPILAIKAKRLSVGTALLAWLIAAILIGVGYSLIRSLTSTVTGYITDSNGNLMVAFPLTLTDSSGIDHKTATDSTGVFRINNVPRGKYTILVENKLLSGNEVPSLWIIQLLQNPMNVGTLVYDPPPTPTPTPTQTPTVTSTSTFTPTQFICPYQGQTDDETIVSLIQAEATATNTKNLDIIMAIFDPNAIFYDGASAPPKSWNGPSARYANDLFKNLEFQNVEHFDIRQVAPGIAGDTAYYTSGSRGQYRGIGAGVFNTFDNGSVLTTKYGSDHWILGRNNQGCWVITKLEFNAGHIPFP